MRDDVAFPSTKYQLSCVGSVDLVSVSYPYDDSHRVSVVRQSFLAPGISRNRRHRTLFPKRNPRPQPKTKLEHGPGAASGRRPDRMRWQRRSHGLEHGSGSGPDGASGGNLISPRLELCLVCRAAGENFWNVPADFESRTRPRVGGRMSRTRFRTGK